MSRSHSAVRDELLADPLWQQLTVIDEVRLWLRFAQRVVDDKPELVEDLNVAQRYLDGSLRRRGLHHQERFARGRLRDLDDQDAALQELTLLFLDDHLLDGTAQDVDLGSFLWHLRQVAPDLDRSFLGFFRSEA